MVRDNVPGTYCVCAYEAAEACPQNRNNDTQMHLKHWVQLYSDEILIQSGEKSLEGWQILVPWQDLYQSLFLGDPYAEKFNKTNWIF